MDKHKIAEILNNIGMLLEIKGENFFKSRAYYEAARAIELLDGDIETLVKENRLKDIDGFGPALSQKIAELVSTGKLGYYEQLKESVPAGLLEMLKIPGLGPKKVKAVYDNLGIASIGELKYACIENRLLKLPGFGSKTQEKILEGIENLGKYTERFHFSHAMQMASPLLQFLRESGLVIRCGEAGSLRRRNEIVKDIDILASGNDATAVIEAFTSYPFAARVTSKGSTRASVVLSGGIAADLRVVADSEYPYALHHFTGSKEHNTSMRHMARQRGIKMNEYGLFREDGGLIECGSEEEIFRVFGMSYIPPELRENNGEIEAAKEGGIPELIDSSDIKGVLHVHTYYSDGLNTIEELVRACAAGGYSYLGISDHSRSAHYAGGLKVDDIKRQHEEIEKIKEKYPNFRVFKGIESDILPDGSLDYDDEVLSWFDFVVASVHTHFKMTEEKMTERVLKAIGNRHVAIIGHPTGRLLLSREPYKINMEEIIKAAAREKVAIEINANPYRLDLDWRFCKAAKEEGCKFAIDPDAHSADGIKDVKYGVNVARKGWLTRDDVINAMDADGIAGIFQLKKRR